MTTNPSGAPYEQDPSLLANQHTELLLRKPQTTKNALKEKFVAIYEAFFMVQYTQSIDNTHFKKGQNPSLHNEHFWEELFLLKVNTAFLERCIILTSEDQLLALKV
jgi:hypothetical protein